MMFVSSLVSDRSELHITLSNRRLYAPHDLTHGRVTGRVVQWRWYDFGDHKEKLAIDGELCLSSTVLPFEPIFLCIIYELERYEATRNIFVIKNLGQSLENIEREGHGELFFCMDHLVPGSHT
ncbi:hypothetical protein EPI10_017074 [Gossypium australe]|uniref:Uncharacterized protein n=1 Tax=Gossypium australe TaxID=47621 RepID=A0A5B6VQW4_9ROSI|nr:hypothetical protein EPI10_017074 [Gossypium australe]